MLCRQAPDSPRWFSQLTSSMNIRHSAVVANFAKHRLWLHGIVQHKTLGNLRFNRAGAKPRFAEQLDEQIDKVTLKLRCRHDDAGEAGFSGLVEAGVQILVRPLRLRKWSAGKGQNALAG